MAWHTPVWYWLAHAALGSFVILVFGGLAVRLCREPARRIRLIELTLLGVLLVPWLSGLPGTPRWSLGWLSEPPTEEAARAPVEDGPTPAGGANAVATGEPPVAAPRGDSRADRPYERPASAERPANAKPQATATPRETDPQPETRFSVSLAVVGVYLVLATLLLLRWLVGVGQLLRLCRSAVPPPSGVVRLLRAVAGPAAERVRLLASDRVRLPIMFCWWRPIIVLPADLCRDG